MQFLQIVELFGPHHTTHELMLSFFIKSFVPLDKERKHELVHRMVGAESSTICKHGLNVMLINFPLKSVVFIIPYTYNESEANYYQFRYTGSMQKYENSQSHCSLGVNDSIVHIQKEENRGCM